MLTVLIPLAEQIFDACEVVAQVALKRDNCSALLGGATRIRLSALGHL